MVPTSDAVKWFQIDGNVVDGGGGGAAYVAGGLKVTKGTTYSMGTGSAVGGSPNSIWIDDGAGSRKIYADGGYDNGVNAFLVGGGQLQYCKAPIAFPGGASGDSSTGFSVGGTKLSGGGGAAAGPNGPGASAVAGTGGVNDGIATGGGEAGNGGNGGSCSDHGAINPPQDGFNFGGGAGGTMVNLDNPGPQYSGTNNAGLVKISATCLCKPIDLTSEVVGILPVKNGGTGLDTSGATAGLVLAADGTGAFVMSGINGGTLP